MKEYTLDEFKQLKPEIYEEAEKWVNENYDFGHVSNKIEEGYGYTGVFKRRKKRKLFSNRIVIKRKYCWVCRLYDKHEDNDKAAREYLVYEYLMSNGFPITHPSIVSQIELDNAAIAIQGYNYQ